MNTSIIAPKANDFSDIKNAIMPFNVLADAYGEDLAAEQLMLEHEAYTLGEKRFLKALARQAERGEICDNAAAKPLLDTLLPALSEHIEDFRNASTGRGKPPVWRKHFLQLESDTLAFIILKTTISSLVSAKSDMVIQGLASKIANNIEDEVRYGRIRDEEAEHFNNKVRDQLNKRNGQVFKKAYMQAVEAGMLANGELESVHESWDIMDKMNMGIRCIEMIMASTGLVVMKREHEGATAMEIISIAPNYADKMSARAGALAGMSPMYQPCIVPPKKWTGIKNGGYWAKGRRPLSFVRVGSKRALERYLDVEMPQVYSAINTIQETAWKINSDVLAIVNAVVNWKNCPVEDIPSVDKFEKPELWEGIEDEDGNIIDEDKFKKWKRNAAAIYRKEKARQSRRLSLEFALEQANKFAKYEAIYFPYNMDWRGRVYAIPAFNPQGNDMIKALLTFAKKVKLGAEGAYWLAVHGANEAGVDKVSLEDRVKWVHDHEEMILNCARNPLECLEWAEMDSPFMFLAFCFEWCGYVDSGYSEDYESSLPLAFDGTCSGLQHFSAMLRDSVGGNAVNLTPSDKPQDVYGIVAEKVNAELYKLLMNGTENYIKVITDKKTGEITEKAMLGTKTAAEQWLKFGVTRSVTKRCVMTLAYGAKKFGFTDQINEDTMMPAIDSGKGDMFTIPSQACSFLAGVIWDAVTKTVIAAVEAMKWLQDAAKLISSEVKDKKTGEVLKKQSAIHWTTPNGFPVWSEYRKWEQKRVTLLFLGQQYIKSTVNVRESSTIDVNKQAAGIAPNFIHSMDSSHLQMVANYCKEHYGIDSFAMIHDSFGCHAGHAANLFKGVRITMVNTYTEHDVIAEFYEEFADQLLESQLDKMPAMPAKGDLDINLILESLYTFS